MAERRFGSEARQLIEELGEESPPTRIAFDRVGDRWSLLIVSVLEVQGAMRFTEIERLIPDLSQRMLSFTLRSLERDGIVTRTAYAEVPPRVEYEITDIGRELLVAMEDLVRWGLRNYAQIRAARDRFDAEH